MVAALNTAPPRGGTGTDAWCGALGRDTNGVCDLRGSFNIASVTRTARGRMTVFDTPMPSDGAAVNVATNESQQQL